MHLAPHLPAQPAADEPATDDELAVQAAGGDDRAFEQIMRRHNRLLFRTARSILKDEREAEEALQDAWLSAWRHLGQFRAQARLSTWLVRIVANEALGRLRERGRAQLIPLDAALQDAPLQGEGWMHADAEEQPDRQAMRGQMRRIVEARIDALPEVFRTVFVLRAVEEWSVEEVAAALRIPPATVRTRFFRARSLMRETLASELDLALGDAFSFDGARCDRIVARVLARLPDSPRGPRPDGTDSTPPR